MKPRISVTKILNIMYPIEESEISEILKMHGRTAHDIVAKEYCRDRSCETEVKLELDRGDYVLVGVADIVDHDNYLVLEIKTKRGFRLDRARLQLSAYVAMYRMLYNNYYYGAWIVYSWNNPRVYYVVRPFYLDMTILDEFDKVVRERIIGKDNRLGKDSSVVDREAEGGGSIPELGRPHGDNEEVR